MSVVITIAQLVLAITLVALILVQPRGTGLSRGFVASSHSFTRRGLDRAIFKLTFIIAFLFVAASFVSILI